MNVKSTSSFINSDTIIKEDIWTSHDSERQRQAKIATQQERMREALAETRSALPLGEELWAEMGRCYAIALEKLSQDGKSAVYTLSEELKPYIKALAGQGEEDASEQLTAFLADIARRMDAYTYLADDAAVAEELDRFDAVVRSCKADARRMLESAQTAGKRTRP